MPQENRDYVLLEPSVISTGGEDGKVDLMSYIQGAYVTMFVVIMAAAVLSLVYYGFNYMISDIPGNKANASNRLKSIAWGLVIALTTVMILELINPDLIKLNLIFPS